MICLGIAFLTYQLTSSAFAITYRLWRRRMERIPITRWNMIFT